MTLEAALPKVMERRPAGKGLRILVLYGRIPFPMMRGDQLTVSHLLSYLKARGHEVDLLTLDVDGVMTSAQQDWLNAVCNRVDILPQSRMSMLGGLLAGVLFLRPLQVGLFENRKMKAMARDRTRSGDYDIVYCYYLRSEGAVIDGFAPDQTQVFRGRKTAAFLAMQLSQTLNTRRIFEHSTSLAKRFVYGLEWWLMRRFEARVWRRFTKVMLIGPKDVEAVEQACDAEFQPRINNWLYGAHGTDVQAFHPSLPQEVEPNSIIFSGSMLYQPNVQAVQWFYKKCWPTVRAARPDAQWSIVGRDPLPEIRALHGIDGITVTGTVPDVGAHIRKAAVCINPMLAAGGMQNKLIEYMASGKAVVATSVANEGILAPPGVAIEIADDPETFAAAVLALLDNPEQAALRGRSAREFVLDNWTWEALFDKLETAFYQALGRREEQ